MTPFVFLDRDGTLVPDVGYPHRLEDCRLLPGVAEGLAALAGGGFRLAVISNQSGIGRGYFSTLEYDAFRRKLEQQLGERGVRLAGSFYCAHPPGTRCSCRKPEPGLLLRARDLLGADLARSWMIGDSLRDAETARRAGCRGAVIVGESVPRDASLPPATWREADLPAAAARILQEAGRTAS